MEKSKRINNFIDLIVYFFMLTMPFSSFALFNLFGSGFNITFLIGVILANIAIYILLYFLLKKSVRTNFNVLFIYILIFYIIIFLSIFMTYVISINEKIHLFNKELWIKSIKSFLYVSVNFFILLFFLFYIRNFSHIKKLIKIFLIGVLINCLIGFYELFAYYLNLPDLCFLHNNISVPNGCNQLFMGIKRMTGLTGEPAMFGFMTGIGYIFLLNYFVENKSFFNKYFDLFLIIIFFVAIILSTSFSVITVMFFYYFLIIYFKDMKINLKKFFSFLVFIFTIFFISYIFTGELYIIDRFFQIIYGENYSAFIRFNMYLSALKIFFHYPILGIGLGNFGFILPNYSLVEISHWWAPMSFLANIIVSTGLLGLIVFLVYLFKSLKYLYKLSTLKKIYYCNNVILSLGIFHSLFFLMFVFLLAIPSFNWTILWVWIAFQIKSLNLLKKELL